MGSFESGAGGTTASVITNDLTNDVAAVIGSNVSLTPGDAPVSGLVMNPDGTVTVDPATPVGTYVYPYTICTIPATSPVATCSTAQATVTVGATIAAQPDTPEAINGATGGTTPTPVTENDTLNGNPVEDPSNVVLTVETPAEPQSPGASVPTLDPVTGLVTVPAGTPEGSYEITYKICVIGNLDICATTTVTVPVSAQAVSAPVPVPVNGLWMLVMTLVGVLAAARTSLRGRSQ